MEEERRAEERKKSEEERKTKEKAEEKGDKVAEKTKREYTVDFKQKMTEQGTEVDMDIAMGRMALGPDDPEGEPKRKDRGKERADPGKGQSEKPTST